MKLTRTILSLSRVAFGVVMVVVVNGCGGDAVKRIEELVETQEAVAEGTTQPAKTAQTRGARPANPDWVYADDFRALHEAQVLGLMPDGEPGALRPHRDAVERAGAAWGIRADAVAWVSVEDGAVYDGWLDVHGECERPAARELDAFEQRGLDALRAGAEIYWGWHARELRGLGAVRYEGTCVSCHGERAGQLAGALSYRFREIHDD